MNIEQEEVKKAGQRRPAKKALARRAWFPQPDYY